METLWQDIRYGARMLMRKPGFTAVAVLTLALGIGANTTVFSLVNAILLRPLPVENPDRLVSIYAGSPTDNAVHAISYPNYVSLRDQAETLSGLAAFGGIAVNLAFAEQTDLVAGEIVTGNYFSVLGVRPVLGRAFLPEEDETPGRRPVVVIGHGLWRNFFASDPGIAGTIVALNGNPYTVVGVAPRGFNSPVLGRRVDLWVPMMMQQSIRPPSAGLRRIIGGANLLNSRDMTWLRSVGRLRDGVALSQARANVKVIEKRLAEAFPESNSESSYTVMPLDETPGLRTNAIPFTTLLLTVVGFVLLIACANVANLSLARATGRRKEIGIRVALGASPARLLRQLFTENLLVASLGGAVALLLTLWTSELLLLFDDIPATLDVSLDGRILAFTFIVSLLAALLFGLAPAWQATRINVFSILKNEGAAGAGGFRRSHLRNLLVVSQVALSLILLIGAGLFIRSLAIAHSADPGFDAERVLRFSINLDRAGYSQEEGEVLYQQLSERVEALPGVESVSMARITPLSGSARTPRITFPDHATIAPEEQIRIHVNVVGLHYFKTLGIALLNGRPFDSTDRGEALPVMIVNQTMARRFWPEQNPLGKRIQYGPGGPLLEIIGVVKDSKYRTMRDEPRPFAYLPLLQNYESGVAIFVRAAGDPSGLIPAVRHEVRAMDSNLPLVGVRTLADQKTLSLGAERLMATLLGIFGGLALVLAAVGIYGMISYSVSQRIHEIGIRIALGAEPRNVVQLVVGQGMKLALLGVAFGLAGAAALTRYVESFLFGMSVMDPVTFAVVALLLVGVALLACLVPARRAARVDPMAALRYE